MEFFEIFGIAPKVNIDLKALKLKYFALSKSFHPDFFTLESVEKQMEAMDQSTLINNAYKALKDEDTRLKYLLDQKNLLSKDSNEQMPPEFLMEMMEFNEKIMDLDTHDAEAAETLKEEVRKLDSEWRQGVLELFEIEFKNLDTDQLDQVKNYFLKKKYVRRLLQNINGVSEL